MNTTVGKRCLILTNLGKVLINCYVSPPTGGELISYGISELCMLICSFQQFTFNELQGELILDFCKIIIQKNETQDFIVALIIDENENSEVSKIIIQGVAHVFKEIYLDQVKTLAAIHFKDRENMLNSYTATDLTSSSTSGGAAMKNSNETMLAFFQFERDFLRLTLKENDYIHKWLSVPFKSKLSPMQCSNIYKTFLYRLKEESNNGMICSYTNTDNIMIDSNQNLMINSLINPIEENLKISASLLLKDDYLKYSILGISSMYVKSVMKGVDFTTKIDIGMFDIDLVFVIQKVSVHLRDILLVVVLCNDNVTKLKVKGDIKKEENKSKTEVAEKEDGNTIIIESAETTSTFPSLSVEHPSLSVEHPSGEEVVLYESLCNKEANVESFVIENVHLSAILPQNIPFQMKKISKDILAVMNQCSTEIENVYKIPISLLESKNLPIKRPIPHFKENVSNSENVNSGALNPHKPL